MKKYIKTSLIILLAFLIVGSCNGDGGSNTVTRTVGPDGETIKSADRKLTLEIPAGALDQDTEITIRKLNPEDFEEMFRKAPDFAYELSPDGLEFNMPVTATIEQDERATDSEGNITFKNVLLFTKSGDEIEMLDNQEQLLDGDTNENTVSGKLMHFTELLSFTFNEFLFTLEGIPDSVPPNSEFTATFTVSAIEEVSQLVSIESDVLIEDESMGSVQGLVDSIRIILPVRGEIEQEPIAFMCSEGSGSALIKVIPEIEEVFPFLLAAIVTRSTSKILGKKVTCMDETSPTDMPPPPQPTPMPTPSPPPTIGDVSGTYTIDCLPEQDPFAIINGNLGIPFIIDVIVEVDPETGDVTITTPEGLFTLMGTIVDQGEGLFRIQLAEGSGFLGGMPPNDANIVVRAEAWTFFVNQDGEIEFLAGVLRFNFMELPLNNQSSVASCIPAEEN